MTIHQNSLYAYWQMRDAGELQPKEMMVLQALEQFGPMTRDRLAEVTGLRLSCICGRSRALLDKGAIEPAGSVLNPATRKPNEVLKLAMRQGELMLEAA